MKTRQFKNIIVGVDFSHYSKDAAEQAKMLSSAWGANIIFAHIYDDRSLILDASDFSEPLQVTWQRYEKEVRIKYLKNAGNARMIVKPGIPEVELVNLAKKHPRSLILVGHKGKGALEKFFVGSVAERLALTSPVPVWIQVGTAKKTVKKALVPCDVNADSSKFLNRVAHLEMLEKSEVDLLYVYMPPAPFLDYQSWMAVEKELVAETNGNLSRIKRKYPLFKLKEAKGDPASVISKLENKYDLIIMAPHHRKFPALGRVSSKVLRKTKRPVFIMPSRS